MGDVNESTPATRENEDTPVNEDMVDSSHELDDFFDQEVSGLPEEVEENVEEVPENREYAEGSEDSPQETSQEDDLNVDPPKEPEQEEKTEAESLREQLTHLSSVLMSHGINPASLGQQVEGGQEVQQPAVETQPAQSQTPDKSEVELKPFELTKEEFDAVFEAPENLVGLLNRVRESAVEQVLRSIPTVTAKIVNQQTVLNRMVQDFYTANNDLASVKPFVAVVANEIAARNPGWNVEQVFAEAAVESRKRLNLKKDAAKPAAQTTGRKPGLPTGTPSRRAPTTPKLSSLEQELKDLM